MEYGEKHMKWWQKAVFYQIYPRSFMDSNGDGVGDLRGAISKLDYLNDGSGGGLGVDALWFSPFFASPMRDFGYDVSDFESVDPSYGSMDDCRELIAQAHRRGMRIVLDLVVNHCSDEHRWFKEARASTDSPKHGWFLWAPMKGRKKPNNWICLFTLKSAWCPNPATGEYYLGTFTPHQPEFNWRNPELRAAVYAVMRHWLDMGVDGFRLDVCTAYFKDDKLRSNPLSWKAVPEIFQEHVYDRNRPEVHGVFREMRAICDAYRDCDELLGGLGGGCDRVLIGEAHGHDPALAASCLGEGDELHMAFNFDFLMSPWKASAFRKSALDWYAALPPGAWPNFTLSNHDQARAASRYRSRLPGPAGKRETEARCRVLCALLLCLRGTPFIYYGEEIGMLDGKLKRKELRDPLGISLWPLPFGRDGGRRPMQWDARANSGFSSAAPWLPASPDYPRRNVEAQSADPESLLSFYVSLIGLRKSEPALISGEIGFLDAKDPILAFERILDRSRIFVALNFSGREKAVSVGSGGAKGTLSGARLRVLAGTHRAPGEALQALEGPSRLSMKGYEILIAAMEYAP
jgi:alpha-glucosidase